MTDYHRDPGYLNLAKGVVRVENRYSHQRDGHYNKRWIQHSFQFLHLMNLTLRNFQWLEKSQKKKLQVDKSNFQFCHKSDIFSSTNNLSCRAWTANLHLFMVTTRNNFSRDIYVQHYVPTRPHLSWIFLNRMSPFMHVCIILLLWAKEVLRIYYSINHMHETASYL